MSKQNQKELTEQEFLQHCSNYEGTPVESMEDVIVPYSAKDLLYFARSILNSSTRIWYSTTKEGATEKHPYKKPKSGELYFGIALKTLGKDRPYYLECRKGKFGHDSSGDESASGEFIEDKCTTHFCERYEDTPPKFEV